MRLLPRSSRGTWLLAGAAWLAGCGALWWALPHRPRAAWPTGRPVAVHGFIPGTSVLLTSAAWMPPIGARPPGSGGAGPFPGPLLARDAATGEVREWCPKNTPLTFVDPGPDGRHVLIGRVVGGRARLFLHDAADGSVIAELPRDGPRAENEDDEPPDAYEQFAAFRPDGRQVVYADRADDRTCLRIWDLQTQRKVAAIADAERPAAWSPDGRTLAYPFHVHGLHLWSVRLWQEESADARPIGSVVPLNAEPLQLAFSPDGTTLVAVLAYPRGGRPRPGKANDLVGWDVVTGNEKYRFGTIGTDFLPRQPSFLAYDLAPGTLLVVRRFDFATGTQTGTLGPEHSQAGVKWLGFSPDGLLMLGKRRHSNGLLELLDQQFSRLGPFVHERPYLFEIETGRLLYSMPMALPPNGLAHPATSCGWSRDQPMLAIAGKDTLAVWDVPPRKPLSWLTAGAALLALPPAVLARWRIRRLRKAVVG
jgi:WD40 repeat protein